MKIDLGKHAALEREMLPGDTWLTSGHLWMLVLDNHGAKRLLNLNTNVVSVPLTYADPTLRRPLDTKIVHDD